MKGWMTFLFATLLIVGMMGLVLAENESVLRNDSSSDSEVVVPDDSSGNEPSLIAPAPTLYDDNEARLVSVTKLPDPTESYCKSLGYSAEVREDTTGKEYKVCVFPDGKECKQTEFMRGKCGREYTNTTRRELVSGILAGIKERIKGRNCQEACWLDVENKNITVRDLSAERKEIIAGKINARTGLNLTAEDIDSKLVLRARLSNGRWAWVKHLPDAASEKAQEKLGAKCEERNCTIELKEVGIGNNTRLAYEISTDRDSRVLLIFKKRMPVMAQVDAETGEVVAVKRPWWAFLAKESNN